MAICQEPKKRKTKAKKICSSKFIRLQCFFKYALLYHLFLLLDKLAQRRISTEIAQTYRLPFAEDIYMLFRIVLQPFDGGGVMFPRGLNLIGEVTHDEEYYAHAED